MLLDVNSVVVSLVGGLMVMHTRAEGVHSLTHLAVIAVWMLVTAPQITGLTRFARAYEVLLAGACVSVLSCMHQAQERTELLALRVFVFVVFNTALPYVDTLMQRHLEPDGTYVNVCRTLLILLGEPGAAGLWVVAYLLCLGYQLRTMAAPGIRGNYRRTHEYFRDGCRPIMPLSGKEAPPPASSDAPPGDHVVAMMMPSDAHGRFIEEDPPSEPSSDDPQQLGMILREALAKRQGFVDEGPV
jgi:hypothetical protein